MKKYKNILIVILAVILIAGAIVVKSSLSAPRQVNMQASWTGQKPDLESAYKSAAIVVIAKVTSAQSDKIHDMVFTNYSLSIEKILKSDIPDTNSIVVSLTGGDMDGVQYRIEEQKLLENGAAYIFLLNKRYPNDPNSSLYTPVGGYQGIIKLEREIKANGKLYIAKPFNDKNELEKKVLDKDIVEYLKQMK